jgi:hypothetical protein
MVKLTLAIIRQSLLARGPAQLTVRILTCIALALASVLVLRIDWAIKAYVMFNRDWNEAQ